MKSEDFSFFLPLDTVVSESRQTVRKLLEMHYKIVSHQKIGRKEYEMSLFKSVVQLITRKWAVEILWELEVHQELSFKVCNLNCPGLTSWL